MVFRGNNGHTFAESVQLDIALHDDSPNPNLFKRKDNETNKP